MTTTPSSTSSATRAALTLAPSNEQTHIYCTPTGEVWVKVSRLPWAHVSTYVVQLGWATKHRVQQVSLGRAPVYLTMNKSRTDKTPLIVTTQPAARIDFGRAALGDADSIGIDDGWTSG